ncbi:FecCD family ABC transporter permease [Nocardia sp. NPDC127579]|uniref:FecCD family ABC transporter permease n=1 Tax=Nocardia sp. NPDC127579 TaxID=3345402 RepID=UPI003638E080
MTGVTPKPSERDEQSGTEHDPRGSARIGSTVWARRHRTALLVLACSMLLPGLSVLALTVGEIPMSVRTAMRALAGAGDPGYVYVVQEFRAPRVAAALIAGAGLAVSGAVLQRLFRNPLASPDVMGVTGGASFGAVSVLALGASQSLIPVGALGGGALAALLLAVIGWGTGRSVIRLVLVGLAVQAGLSAAVNLLVVRFPRELAGAALQWTAGSLYGRTWTEVAGAAAAGILMLSALFAQYRTLAVLDLGDEMASTLGIRVGRARFCLLGTAITLAALAAAIAGPVSFVALAIPHIVRLIAGPPTATGLAATGLTGAALLLGCDLVVQHALPVSGLPVGVITATVGAPWLLVLMLRENTLRRSA